MHMVSSCILISATFPPLHSCATISTPAFLMLTRFPLPHFQWPLHDMVTRCEPAAVLGTCLINVRKSSSFWFVFSATSCMVPKVAPSIPHGFLWLVLVMPLLKNVGGFYLPNGSI